MANFEFKKDDIDLAVDAQLFAAKYLSAAMKSMAADIDEQAGRFAFAATPPDLRDYVRSAVAEQEKINERETETFLPYDDGTLTLEKLKATIQQFNEQLDAERVARRLNPDPAEYWIGNESLAEMIKLQPKAPWIGYDPAYPPPRRFTREVK